jgi:ribulose-5-phosphate 4-epimerase/fuculose-1-phosphate aldolase
LPNRLAPREKINRTLLAQGAPDNQVDKKFTIQRINRKHLDGLIDELAFGTRLLFKELGDPWGHIAVRLPKHDGAEGFLLKHVRATPPPGDPDAVMLFDYDGNVLDGERRIPWELPLYTSIFKTRPDVQSVIHTHPLVATALSMAGKTVFAITHQSAPFEHGIPIFRGDMVNNQELGDGLAEALGKKPAALLKGHGAVVVGSSIGHAVQTTLYLEQAARQQIWAATLGTPEVLDQDLIDFHKNLPPGDGGLALWHTKKHYDSQAPGAGFSSRSRVRSKRAKKR